MGGLSSRWAAGQNWYENLMREGQPIRSPQALAGFLKQWGKDIATFQGVAGLNDRTELIARTAAMRRAEAAGASPIESMIAGRDASIDFDRFGTTMRNLNHYIPFLGARSQGSAQFFRTFRDHPGMASAAVLGAVVPAVAASEAWNRSDPQRAAAYDDVPQYLKDNGIVAMLPWAGSDQRGNRPNYLWIPAQIDAPFIIAAREAMTRVPGLSDAAARGGITSDPERWARAFGAITSSLSPLSVEAPGTFLGSFAPPIVKQGYELATNTDLYRGTSISSQYADDRASALSKAAAAGVQGLGQATGSQMLQNVRPSQAEYLMRQVPAYGDVLTGVSDILAPSPYKQLEQRPIQNEPFAGGIVGRFIRDTGGEDLRRVQAQAWTPLARSMVAEAGLRPDQVDLTAALDISKMPLSRDEQLDFQNGFNDNLDPMLERIHNSLAWDRYPERRAEMVRMALTAARARASSVVLRGIPTVERTARIREALAATP